MNKKVVKKEKQYDDKEDKRIRKAAYSSSASQILLLFVLIVLFGFTLFNSLYYIGKYYWNEKDYEKGIETIEINNKKNTVFILNQGDIDKKVSENDKEEIVLVNESSIELTTNKDEAKDGKITFDVKYNISENDFPVNLYSKEDSDVRVRFAYSYDNENWTYISNTISTYESTINPLLQNYYDISGIVSTLKIATNFELTSAPGEKSKIYWKSETTIKNKESNLNKGIKANFKIEYKESL